jgi:hypothetical protein
MAEGRGVRAEVSHARRRPSARRFPQRAADPCAAQPQHRVRRFHGADFAGEAFRRDRDAAGTEACDPDNHDEGPNGVSS